MNKILDDESNNLETQEEVDLILERLEEVKNGKVKSLDDAIKDFVNERELWKTLV